MLQKNRCENKILEGRTSSNRKGFKFPRRHTIRLKGIVQIYKIRFYY